MELFLSTLPARGATCGSPFKIKQLPDFYPRSPRGERPLRARPFGPGYYFYPRSPRGERLIISTRTSGLAPISIHAPREGSDPLEKCVMRPFLVISIHAPREGSDGGTAACSGPHSLRFLSTLPARGATGCKKSPALPGPFLSTLPARGATKEFDADTLYWIISIHAPREGSDAHKKRLCHHREVNFYPRSPRGERLVTSWALIYQFPDFYPRSPRGERRPRPAPPCAPV